MRQTSVFPHTIHLDHTRYRRYLARIIAIFQQPSMSSDTLLISLQSELRRISDGRLQLHLFSSAQECQWDDKSYAVAWDGVAFGALIVTDDATATLEPDYAERLACDIGWLLASADAMRFAQQARNQFTDALRYLNSLPRKQRMVLDLMAQGATNAEIAARLHIQIKTVYTHQNRLYRRLEVHTRWQATRLGMIASIGAELASDSTLFHTTARFLE